MRFTNLGGSGGRLKGFRMGRATDVEESCDTLDKVWKTPDTTTWGMWKSQKKGARVPSPGVGGRTEELGAPLRGVPPSYSDVTGDFADVENCRFRAFPGRKAPFGCPLPMRRTFSGSFCVICLGPKRRIASWGAPRESSPLRARKTLHIPGRSSTNPFRRPAPRNQKQARTGGRYRLARLLETPTDRSPTSAEVQAARPRIAGPK